MLSEYTRLYQRVFEICARCPDIKRGESFRWLTLVDGGRAARLTGGEPILCSGHLRPDEPLFRTLDGRVRFTLREGWGGEYGVLYGLAVGRHYDFGVPTEDEEIPARLAELEAKSAHSCCDGLALQEKKTTLRLILEALERTE